MDLIMATNTELVKSCAQDPANRNAWNEFYNRFDKRIWMVVYRECEAKGISDSDYQYDQTIKDLVQDVYKKLIENDCKALKNFIGASENSIYTYLGIIARNVVRNHITKTRAQKRPLVDKSIDEIFSNSDKQNKIFIKDKFISDYGVEQEFSAIMLKEEIEDILCQFLNGKDKERNKLIFKLHLYEGFSPDDIASQFSFGLSSKRISNLITGIKKNLQTELLRRETVAY